MRMKHNLTQKLLVTLLLTILDLRIFYYPQNLSLYISLQFSIFSMDTFLVMYTKNMERIISMMIDSFHELVHFLLLLMDSLK